MALTFRGARPIGQDQADHLAFEAKIEDPIGSFPDSAAGMTEAKLKAELAKADYLKRPPDKRPNYRVLATPSPFRPPWSALTRAWREGLEVGQDDGDAIFVVRDKVQLREWQALLNVDRPDIGISRLSSAVLAVSLDLKGKGVARANAMICLPTEEDVESLIDPMEPPAEDDAAEKRKVFHQAHVKAKAKLRKKWKEAKDRLVQRKRTAALKGETLAGEDVQKAQAIIDAVKASRNEESTTFEGRMADLWLPPDPPPANLRDVASRSVIGFVVRGDYSLRTGKGCAVGFVSALALARWPANAGKVAESGRRLVLVREIDSGQYRFAFMSLTNI